MMLKSFIYVGKISFCTLVFMSIYIKVWIVETFSYIQNVEYKNSDQTSNDIAVLVLTIFGSFGSSFCGIN